MALGRLDPERFLGGDLSIDRELAEKAIKEHIADPLGLSITEAALGILKIINNNMALAINANSVAKGIDPRGFTLMGFGGAGPLHSVALADMIQARDVISPLQPGITAAMGLLVTDLKYEYTRSVLQTLDDADDAAIETINTIAKKLIEEATAQLEADGIAPSARKFEKIMECRYLGQGFELRADMPYEALTQDNKKEIIDSFFNVHKEAYGHAFRDQITEGVTLRVVASADVDQLTLSRVPHGGRDNPSDALMYTLDTIFDDGTPKPTPRYERTKLGQDDRIEGPAIVTQHNSTTIVPPGYRATVLEFGDMRVARV